MPTAIARRLLAADQDKPARLAVVDREPDLWGKFIDDTELIEGMLATGKVLVVTVADNPQPVMIASQSKVESELGPIAELPRWTASGLREPAKQPDPTPEPEDAIPPSDAPLLPDDAPAPIDDEDWVPVKPQPKRYKRGDYIALDIGQFWLSAELEGEDDPTGYLTERLGQEVTPSDLAEAIERLIDDELSSGGEEWVRADGRKVLVLRDIVDDVSELFIGADKERLMQRLLKETQGVLESWGGAWGGAEQAPSPEQTRPLPEPTSPPERVERPPAETPSPAGALPPEIVDKMQDAHSEVEWLIGRRRSIESGTGYALKPKVLEAAYSELEKALDEHGAELEGEPGDEPYDPASGELVPRLRRLLGLLRGILRRRRAIDAADVNHYRLEHLRRDVVDFLHHEKAASCDVLQRRPTVDMPSEDIDNLRGGGACGACVGGGPKVAAERLLSKVALQLSKGNIRATKGGQITVDPGLMNCPVVRAVIRELDTKASDMQALRERLDDMGMLVTQGSHGQVQVYCLSRTEGEGGAQTRMCQWFIDAHGNDGKFKIECAKD